MGQKILWYERGRFGKKVRDRKKDRLSSLKTRRIPDRGQGLSEKGPKDGKVSREVTNRPQQTPPKTTKTRNTAIGLNSKERVTIGE